MTRYLSGGPRVCRWPVPATWQRIDEVFQAALELAPADRASFLEQECADDPDVRSKVAALLSSHEESGSFLENPLAVFGQEESQTQLMRQRGPDPSSMEGRRLGHYMVHSKLGRGGMGVVYRAYDDRLNRAVALKVLPPEVVSDPERKRRFIQEARAASALNHPHIVTIHGGRPGNCSGLRAISSSSTSRRTFHDQGSFDGSPR